MTSQLIGKYIGTISINEDLNSSNAVKFNEDAQAEVRILKQITDYIISSPTLAAQQHGQKRIISELFNALWGKEKYDADLGYPPFLPGNIIRHERR